jgi:hypothetical protein
MNCILMEEQTKPGSVEAAMSDVDEFRAEIHPRLVGELTALHNGDPQPRLAMWSAKDPVTLFGATMSGSGWDQVSRIFRSIASRWSNCADQRVEITPREHAGLPGGLSEPAQHPATPGGRLRRGLGGRGPVRLRRAAAGSRG